MVEGGRIDQGHHEGWAQRALNETIAFDAAIEKAISMVNMTETLVIVTADHSHNMVFSGYAKRGSDVTGTPFIRFITRHYIKSSLTEYTKSFSFVHLVFRIGR